MASYHGKNSTAFFHLTGGNADGSTGYVEFVNIRSWTCTLTAATADTTGMGANGRTQVAGLIGGTASVECGYDNATYVQLDESDNAVYTANSTGIQLQLLRDATDASKGYMGGVICTGVNVSQSIDDIPIITYNFQWTGTVTSTTTAGT
jgi:hypothetical protein